MKKVFTLLFIVLVAFGCSLLDDSKEITKEDIIGYWVQLESDLSGKVNDMRDNPYAYLEITDNKLFFYTESTADKGYYDTVAEKHYVFEDKKLYYDYYELKDKNWKKKISEFGGVFEISFEKKSLILTKDYENGTAYGYEKNTYKKVKDSDRLLDLKAKIN